MTATILEVDCAGQRPPSNVVPKTSKAEKGETLLAKPRILVIDDDACFCELLSLYFMAKGFDVVAARSAAQGESLVDRGGFDLVILDWYIDGGDALDLLNRSKRRYPEIPVIIVTGSDVELLLKPALAGRVDGILRKMASLESLSSHVCHHLGWPELRVVK